MSTKPEEYKKGLEGVIAGESKISLVEGIEGRLYYRGYDIADIIQHSCFEEVAFLLLNGTIPSPDELKNFSEKLFRYQIYNPTITRIIKDISKDTHPMKVLQICVAAIGGIWDNKDGSRAQEAFIAYIAQLPLITAAYWRTLNNLDFIEPLPSLNFAGNFLYMLHGKMPTRKQNEAFDKTLILHMEHGFNASTFTARVVASSLAPLSASLSAAVGSLSGPLHGGANERVIEMLEEIGSIDNVKSFIDNKVATKGKIMGMGHREYRAKDPRATLIQKILHDMIEDDEGKRKVAILEEVEKNFTARMEAAGKQIYPNVDFYSGTLFLNLNINPLLFTPIFAIARVVGWCANISEQWEDNRIFRPKSIFVGEIGRKYLSNYKKPADKSKALKILIVDDDTDIVESIKIALEANGMQVVAKYNDKNVPEFVIENKPDLVLLDVIFPENSTAGFEICRALKKNSAIAKIPVILLSAINKKFNMAFSISQKDDASSIPADKFLEKPVNPEHLINQINDLLSK